MKKEEFYYSKIRNNLIDVEINNKVKDYSKNKYTLEKYYEIGKTIIYAQGGEKRAKYGDGLIRAYSSKLSEDLGINYSYTTLSRMRQFYLIFSKIAHSAQHFNLPNLSWSHIQAILSLKDINEISYYIDKCINNNLSRNKLREIIKSNDYKRLPKSTKDKLSNNNKLTLTDSVKDPIIIKNNLNIEEISEKAIHKLILDDITSFMKELGDGYSFIDHEYKIKIGDEYNYIDFLFFNYIFNAFVVIEVKIGKLKKGDIGQNYINNNLKNNINTNTIGIILFYEYNKYIMKYSSDSNITIREFILK